MLGRSHAAELLAVDDLAFESLSARGLIHTIATVSGSLLVCGDSLVAWQR